MTHDEWRGRAADRDAECEKQAKLQRAAEERVKRLEAKNEQLSKVAHDMMVVLCDAAAHMHNAADYPDLPITKQCAADISQCITELADRWSATWKEPAE